jgi:hypothetical protein
MPLMGFKPTIQVFELAETVHALDRVFTVIGTYWEIKIQKILIVISYP